MEISFNVIVDKEIICGLFVNNEINKLGVIKNNNFIVDIIISLMIV